MPALNQCYCWASSCYSLLQCKQPGVGFLSDPESMYRVTLWAESPVSSAHTLAILLSTEWALTHCQISRSFVRTLCSDDHCSNNPSHLLSLRKKLKHSAAEPLSPEDVVSAVDILCEPMNRLLHIPDQFSAKLALCCCELLSTLALKAFNLQASGVLLPVGIFIWPAWENPVHLACSFIQEYFLPNKNLSCLYIWKGWLLEEIRCFVETLMQQRGPVGLHLLAVQKKLACISHPVVIVWCPKLFSKSEKCTFIFLFGCRDQSNKNEMYCYYDCRCFCCYVQYTNIL